MNKRAHRIFLSILLPVIAAAIFYAYISGQTKIVKLNWAENMDEVAVVVDGEPMTFRDLTFYVLYQENKTEEQARLYNPDSPKDYWNIHTNGYFISSLVKEAVMGMAVHDRIMLNRAREKNLVLTTDEKNELEDSRTRYWDTLYPEQLEKLPLSYEDGNRVMKEIALGEAYTQRLCVEMKTTMAGLGWDGYDYENFILPNHKVEINEKLWDKVVMGDNSLIHDKVNYINGLSDEDIERIKNDKAKKSR